MDKIKERIEKAVRQCVIGLPLCHNPDVVLHTMLHSALSDLVYEGYILEYRLAVTPGRHPSELSVMLTITIDQRTPVYHWDAIAGIKTLKPVDKDERWKNFDE